MRIVAVLTTCLLASALFDLSEGKSRARRIPIKVLRVLDGDTVDVEDGNGQKIQVRLIYIDAPGKVQPFGSDSKQFLKSLTEGQQLELVAHRTDTSGRTLGELYLPEVNVNQVMVHNGFARCYRNRCPKSYRKRLQQAKGSKVGLWAGAQPQASCAFRKKPKNDFTKADDVIAAIPKIKSSRKGTKTIEVKLGWVADGDTVTVFSKETNEKMKIRMNFIDAPETSQEGGQASKKFLVDLIQERYLDKLGASHPAKLSVRIYGKDYFHRYLAVLFINGKDVNKLMVKKGHAWCYKTGCPYGYFKALKTARKLNAGLWAEKNPQAPWIYRAERRNRRRKSKNV